jgi:hypothetical protein
LHGAEIGWGKEAVENNGGEKKSGGQKKLGFRAKNERTNKS